MSCKDRFSKKKALLHIFGHINDRVRKADFCDAPLFWTSICFDMNRIAILTYKVLIPSKLLFFVARHKIRGYHVVIFVIPSGGSSSPCPI
jgi:hypothetical protein